MVISEERMRYASLGASVSPGDLSLRPENPGTVPYSSTIPPRNFSSLRRTLMHANSGTNDRDVRHHNAVFFGGSMYNRNLCLTLRSALLLLAVCLSLRCYAQFSASLGGTVEDSTGAIIPKATATLTNLGTQQILTVVTGNTGFYHFSELAPAHYKLVVTAPGFRTST